MKVLDPAALLPRDRAVFDVLDGDEWRTKTEIAELAGISRRAVSHALSRLRALGVADVEWTTADNRWRRTSPD